MLDLKYIVENFNDFKQNISRRKGDFSFVDELPNLDKKRREIIVEVEQLKAKKNSTSKQIGKIKREGGDVSSILSEIDNIGDIIKDLDTQLADIDEKIRCILVRIPNLVHDSVPNGETDEDNLEIKVWGDKREFNFTPKPHWELGELNGILEFERASKISGSRASVHAGLGARLERGLINFMMDLHTTQHHYKEMAVPYIVNEASMFGSGQLPKFAEDAFKTEVTGHYLIPTTEVPLINLHRDETLSVDDLPIYYTGYSANFRKEAGSAGKDTRGIIRKHMFKKVEMIKFTTPETSEEELEKMTHNAEAVLQLLELPYRIVNKCTGDLGFTATKTYDLEVWVPSANTYREISSVSNVTDFQARRANIKFKRDIKGKPEYLHTLNGTGVAVERLMVAVLENYQQEDGSITIPEKLVSYMGGVTKIG